MLIFAAVRSNLPAGPADHVSEDPAQDRTGEHDPDQGGTAGEEDEVDDHRLGVRHDEGHQDAQDDESHDHFGDPSLAYSLELTELRLIGPSITLRAGRHPGGWPIWDVRIVAGHRSLLQPIGGRIRRMKPIG